MRFLGKPWTPGGRGPDAFDCWGLCAYIYEHVFGASGAALAGFDDPSSITSLGWTAIAIPRAFCVVLMRQRGGWFHAGLWMESDGGGVLHCMPDCGTVFTRKRDLDRLSLDITGFYAHDNFC